MGGLQLSRTTQLLNDNRCDSYLLIQLNSYYLLITAAHYYFIYSDTSVIANMGSSSAFYNTRRFSTIQDPSCLNIMKCNTIFFYNSKSFTPNSQPVVC